MRTRYFIITMIITVLVFSAFYWQNQNKEIRFHTESDYGSIWVFDSNGTRCMSFIAPPSPVLQSCMYLSDGKAVPFNYIMMFLSTLFIQDDPKKILVIGLGGASIQKSLNILLPNTKINSVEINPAIPPITEKYFFYKKDTKNKIIVKDGVEYVKNSPPNKYDIIFIDAFDADYIPEGLLTKEFMSDIKRILTKGGIVVMNTFVSNKSATLETRLFKETFGQYYNLQRNTARVLIGRADKSLPNYQKIIDNAKAWSYKMSEIGINQSIILPLYKDALCE